MVTRVNVVKETAMGLDTPTAMPAGSHVSATHAMSAQTFTAQLHLLVLCLHEKLVHSGNSEREHWWQRGRLPRHLVPSTAPPKTPSLTPMET